MVKVALNEYHLIYTKLFLYRFIVLFLFDKASEDLENMETLAQMAASQNETSTADGESYIEKYLKGVQGVESILMVDRLRQEVAVKELSSQKSKSLTKTYSVPNIHQVSLLSKFGLRIQSSK